jgi:tetratricopeptide (TPR) repeat protein
VATALALAAAPPLPAHDSPEHSAELVTARLQREGRSPALLWERAQHYRELGRLAEAEADLAAACAGDPANLDAANTLARVQFQRGQPTPALATLERALAQAGSDAARAPLLLTRAEIRTAQGDAAAALADCDRAFAAAQDPDLDWYLLRAQLQLRAGRAAAAAAGLERGFAQTGSAVLEAEWIEALIDAGQAQAALARIEGPLADSRWRSSWLLRRARARLVLGDNVRARGDARAALRELEERLQTPRPDPSLLLDRGLAHALLGETNAARGDLTAARAAGAEPGATWRLESRLAAAR